MLAIMDRFVPYASAKLLMAPHMAGLRLPAANPAGANHLIVCCCMLFMCNTTDGRPVHHELDVPRGSLAYRTVPP